MGIAGPARLLSPATMGRYGPGCCLQDATQQRGAVIPGVERCALARRDEATGGKKRPHAHRRRIASSGRDEMNNHLWIMGSRSLHRPGYSVRAPQKNTSGSCPGWEGLAREGEGWWEGSSSGTSPGSNADSNRTGLPPPSTLYIRMDGCIPGPVPTRSNGSWDRGRIPLVQKKHTGTKNYSAVPSVQYVGCVALVRSSSMIFFLFPQRRH